MTVVSYDRAALKDLREYGNAAGRLRAAFNAYAADPQPHANNGTRLVGLTQMRMRLGDFRILVFET